MAPVLRQCSHNNSLIVTICLFSIDVEKDKAEIGYELIPEFQGKGFLQESISTVVKFAIDILRINPFDHT